MNYDIADPSLAESGARRIAWAGRRMEVLDSVRRRFRDEKPLEGHVIAACLHVTAETANLTRNQVLQQAGISVLAQANVSSQSALALLQ